MAHHRASAINEAEFASRFVRADSLCYGVTNGFAAN